MKFLIPALVLIGLFAVVLGGILYAQVKISNEPIALPATALPATPTSSAAAGTAFTPPAFHGPTGNPKIIGPTKNPPDY